MRRMESINGVLQKEVSDVLLFDLNDPRLAKLITVTRVQTSNDLKYAKVYVSILDDSSNEDIGNEIMDVLNKASGFISKKMKEKIKFKTVPRLDFFLDNSANDGRKVLDLLEQVTYSISGE
tara:strand:+ start:323 stop:685 length:363 start_codon:yes stop_codon:yes gene_type:complete